MEKIYFYIIEKTNILNYLPLIGQWAIFEPSVVLPTHKAPLLALKSWGGALIGCLFNMTGKDDKSVA